MTPNQRRLKPMVLYEVLLVNAEEWSIVVAVAMSAVLGLGPWMFMVHAKLAVLANQVAVLCKKVDAAADSHEKLWTLYARHEAKLETHDAQISQISERLRDILDN